MRRSTVIFFFAALLLVIAIARYNSRSRVASERGQRPVASESKLVPAPAPASPVASRSAPVAEAQPSEEQPIDFKKAAKQVQPAVARISVFEPSGKLLRNGTGFFISGDGKIVTCRSLMEGAAYAVAKMSGGKIANISGILAETETFDLAILQAEPDGRVPFVKPEETGGVKEGEKVAIIDSPAEGKPPFFQDVVSKRMEQGHAISLELSFPVPNESLGSPVLNEKGQVIGAVTGPAGAVVRTFGAIEPVVAEASSDVQARWLVAEKAEQSPAPPAEAPSRKVPLADGTNGTRSRLVYSPAPRYPSGILQPGMPRRDGRFRIVFSRNGAARSVTIIRSTQNEELDRAAIEALSRWRAAPGDQWVLNVPITFQP